jgi:hypothetical protein
MQPQVTSPRTGKLALRSGLIAGVLLGAFHSSVIVLSAIHNASGLNNTPASSTLFYLITPLIWIVALLAVGTWVGKMSGKVATATLAGLFAGLFGGLVASFGQAIASAISVSLSPTPSDTAILATSLGFFAIFTILFLAIGAGAGCGALGGLIGQSISDVRPQIISQPHPIAQPPTPVYQPREVPYGYMPQTQTPQPRYQEIEMRLPEQ